MKISGILKQYVEIQTEPIELIKELFFHFFNTKNYDILVEKDGKLYFENDVSTHGTPIYEYIEVTNDPKKIEIFRALKSLLINI